MADYKRNHYNTEALVKEFTDKDEFYLFDKDKPEKGVAHRNARNVFWQSNIYVAPTADGGRDVSVERDFIKRIEDRALPIFSKIRSAVRNGRHLSLSRAKKSALDEFQILQFKRVPEIWEQVPHMVDQERAVELAIERIEAEFGPLNADDRRELASQRVRREIFLRARVGFITDEMPLSRFAFANRGLYVARVPDCRKAFVIGSCPQARKGGEGKPLIDPVVEMWLPISHDIAISPGGPIGTIVTRTLSAEQVRRLNLQIARQSRMIGGRSPELLQSLTHAR